MSARSTGEYHHINLQPDLTNLAITDRMQLSTSPNLTRQTLQHIELPARPSHELSPTPHYTTFTRHDTATTSTLITDLLLIKINIFAPLDIIPQSGHT